MTFICPLITLWVKFLKKFEFFCMLALLLNIKILHMYIPTTLLILYLCRGYGVSQA